MIKVTIEVWEHGDPTDSKMLGEAFISNTLTGTPTRGIYKYTLRSKGQKFRKGRVGGFERKRKNVWWLLYYVLKDAIWEQQGEMKV